MYTCIAKKAHSKKDKESMLRSKIIRNYVLILFLHMILDIELSLHKMVIIIIIIIIIIMIIIIIIAAKSMTLLSSGN
jgi:RsiW-degrading membrane proteinase PrsW (M82 family)